MAKDAKAKAIEFVFDLDNRWDGDFFIAEDYVPQSETDPDWGEDWGLEPIATFYGPSLLEFADIYRENGYSDNQRAVGSTALLVARTVAAFGRVAEQADLGNLAVCIAYHDRGASMRIQERS